MTGIRPRSERVIRGPGPASRDGQSTGVGDPRRDAILQAIAYAANIFLRSTRLEDSVPPVLERLGEAAGVSRAYVFECRSEGGRRLWTQRFEWAAPDVEPQIDNPLLRDVALEDIGFGRWEAMLGAGGVIQGVRADFPPAERRMMEDQEILALLAMPIFVEDRWWGFIGFDDCTNGEAWSPDLVTTLGAAADLFGGFLNRKELEDRFRCLVEATDEGVLIHDGEKVVDVNPRGLRMLGYGRDEVIGVNPFDFVAAESADTSREHVRLGSPDPYEVELLHRDGTRIPVQLRGGTAHFGGRAVRVVSIVDLTGRKEAERNERALLVEQVARAEAELAEARARFLAEASRILSSSFDYSTTLASVARLVVPRLGDYCVVDVAQASRIERVATVHADPGQEPLVRRLSGFTPEPEWEHDPVVTVMRTGEPLLVARPEDIDPSHLSYSPGHLDLLIELRSRSAMFVPIPFGRETIGVITLVCTDRERTYEIDDVRLVEDLAERAGRAIENARLYDEAQRATRARDDVLAVVAHDLRNPLGAIIGGATMIREQAADPAIGRFADIIQRSGERMNRLIQDLLDVTRIERGRLGLHPTPLAAASVLQEVDATFAPLARSEGIELTTAAGPDLPAISADAARLLQVFGNLIGNAVKFTPEGGTIYLRCASGGGEVRFSVSDTGPGIRPDEIPHLFSRFWQADSADHRGVGLGLSIAKGIIDAHDGRIWVESEPGKGATFHFSLPALDGGQDGTAHCESDEHTP
jgi:PAS domain S-box-containing protein